MANKDINLRKTSMAKAIGIQESKRHINEDKGKIEKGSTVIALNGPHKGDKHEVIWDFGDGTFNVQPMTNKVRYAQGAAKAKLSDLKLVEENDDEMDDEMDESHEIDDENDEIDESHEMDDEMDDEIDESHEMDDEIDESQAPDLSLKRSGALRDRFGKSESEKKAEAEAKKKARPLSKNEIRQGLASIKAQPKSKVTLKKTPWDESVDIEDDDEDLEEDMKMVHKAAHPEGGHYVVLDNANNFTIRHLNNGKVKDIGTVPSLGLAKSYIDAKVKGKDPKDMLNKLSKEDTSTQSDGISNMDKYMGAISKSVSEAKSGSGYELYHKDFSGAMKHAYDHAKNRLGVDIDPQDIDDKVASGPKKPSSGKTNSYTLKSKDGKSSVQIQVANLDDKRYELNMYKS